MSLVTLAAILGTALAIVAVREGAAGLEEGFAGTGSLLKRAVPVTLLGMVLAGMLQVLIPPNTIGRWMGDDSGIVGLLIGMGAGMLTPGGPYVMYPIGAALMASGAGIAPMASFASGRNLLTLNRLVIWELPFLGPPFTVMRLIVSIWMPLVSVLLVPVIYRFMPQALKNVGPRKRPEDAR